MFTRQDEENMKTSFCHQGKVLVCAMSFARHHCSLCKIILVFTLVTLVRILSFYSIHTNLSDYSGY